MPALGLEPPAPAQGRKLAAYASTWRAWDAPEVRPLEALAAGVCDALAATPRGRGGELASHAQAALGALLGPDQCAEPPP